jgi:hypothetical protein
MSRWRADLDHPTRADVEPAFTTVRSDKKGNYAERRWF